MLKATTFSYAGRHSSEFGLLIASLDNTPIQNTNPFSYTVGTAKTHSQNRFLYTGIESDSPPQYVFSIFGDKPIDDLNRRDILTWLVGRDGFRELVFDQHDRIDYTYNCIFSSAEVIYHRGNCVGFTITATFDSEYCTGRTRKYTMIGDGENKEYFFKARVAADISTIKVILDSPLVNTNQFDISFIDKNGNPDTKPVTVSAGKTIGEIPIKAVKEPKFTLTHSEEFNFSQTSPYHILKVYCPSDFADGYTFPTLKLVGEQIEIVNSSDPGDFGEARIFRMQNLLPEEEIYVNNNLKIIESSNGRNVLPDFNFNWLRLVRGLNILKIAIDGSCEIEVTPRIKIGF